ncbi:unnamed protein product [marine sediment metagenome]|uniref:Uncharacterized protein n=1 Tax=marine sediment metagenome TaxID=412755 RepID=X1Q2H1_9ZZZZ
MTLSPLRLVLSKTQLKKLPKGLIFDKKFTIGLSNQRIKGTGTRLPIKEIKKAFGQAI